MQFVSLSGATANLGNYNSLQNGAVTAALCASAGALIVAFAYTLHSCTYPGLSGMWSVGPFLCSDGSVIGTVQASYGTGCMGTAYPLPGVFTNPPVYRGAATPPWREVSVSVQSGVWSAINGIRFTAVGGAVTTVGTNYGSALTTIACASPSRLSAARAPCASA